MPPTVQPEERGAELQLQGDEDHARAHDEGREHDDRRRLVVVAVQDLLRAGVVQD